MNLVRFTFVFLIFVSIGCGETGNSVDSTQNEVNKKTAERTKDKSRAVFDMEFVENKLLQRYKNTEGITPEQLASISEICKSYVAKEFSSKSEIKNIRTAITNRIEKDVLTDEQKNYIEGIKTKDMERRREASKNEKR